RLGSTWRLVSRRVVRRPRHLPRAGRAGAPALRAGPTEGCDMSRVRWARVKLVIPVAVAMVGVWGAGQIRAQQGAVRRCGRRDGRVVRPGGPGRNRLARDGWVVATGQPFAVAVVGSTDRDGRRAFVGRAGLGDLRLFDSANREVPYLLVPPVQAVPKWVTGALLPLVETKSSSGFEVTLEQSMPVDRLRIEGLPSRFLKRAAVEGSGDRARWTALAPQATLFDLPDDRLKQLD